MKLYLSLIIAMLTGTTVSAQQSELNFTHQNINFSAAPRTTINPMSIKLWDNYANGGGPTTYGTVLEIYGLSSHQTSQLYFGGWDDSKIRYREAFYADNVWNSWITLLDSKNNVESAGRLMVSGSGNHFINGGNVGIGTISPGSKLSIIGSGTGLSFDAIGGSYFGGIAFNREVRTGAIFNASAKAFQINNGGGDQNLHFQVYNGDGSGVSGDALVISGTNANVGIGTATPTEKLAVNGKIRAKEIKVEPTGWSDYVFEDDYKIASLAEIEKYIKVNKHLPEMPTAKEVAANGVDLGEMNKLLLKKVEELTLHLIEKEKQLNAEIKRNASQEERIKSIEKLLQAKKK